MGNGDQLVITKNGGSDYAVFVGSAESNGYGTRMFGVNGMREHDPGMKFFIRSDRQIDWRTHTLKHCD